MDVVKSLTHSEMRGGSESQVVVVVVVVVHWLLLSGLVLHCNHQPQLTSHTEDVNFQMQLWSRLFWQKDHWSQVGTIPMLSTICLPRASHGTSAGGETELGAPALPCLPPHSLLAGR